MYLIKFEFIEKKWPDRYSVTNSINFQCLHLDENKKEINVIFIFFYSFYIYKNFSGKQYGFIYTNLHIYRTWLSLK